ncbi:MAG: NADAR family protein [Verrucomicrobiae bacterium]|nr:NADAR family protein [Verrucomicrobiae bacterium]
MEIRFYSKSPDYAWLSNFAEHGGFSLGGRAWRSVEHFYQAQKFEDSEMQRRIQAAETPLKARKIASNREMSPRADWEAIKEGVMKEGLRAKFGQNRRLRKLLLDTGEAQLVHVSSSDLFWGRNEAEEGQNRLGELLAEVREELRREKGG